MFIIFLTCVIATFTVFSTLFAKALKKIFTQKIKYTRSKVFLINFILLIFLASYKFMPWTGKIFSAVQLFIIIIFTSEIFAGVFFFLFSIVERFYHSFAAAPTDASRRRFLFRAGLLPVEGLVLYGSLIERNDILINKYDIKLPHAGAWSGTKIAQLTDVHLGSYFSLDKLRETLDRLAALSPDVLAVTGDIFDDDKINKKAVALLGNYCSKFKYGIYYCWGNHEYMRDMNAIRTVMSKTAVHRLTNSNITLTKNSEKLTLIGVDYPHERNRFGELAEEYMKKAVADMPADSIKILLAHHSDFIDNAFANDIDLALTGHTHGSQLGIFGQPLFPVFKYTRGMFQKDGHYGYVSTGAGSWFPYRLGCPPETTLFTLV